MSAEYSTDRIQKYGKTKKLLRIILSSGSFDDQFRDLNMFFVSEKLLRHLEQPGFEKYGNDMKSKCFDNMANMNVTSSKSKGKFSNDT